MNLSSFLLLFQVPHMAELISRLLTWITLTVVFPIVMLSISWTCLECFLFQAFLEVEIRVLNGTSPIDRDLGIEAMQYATNITRNVPC